MNPSDQPEATPDSLIYNDVGAWTADKHRLVSYYAAEFSNGMKDKWHERVYIELYAGAGYGRIKHSERIILGSPIRALMLNVPFNKYIFCEENPDKLAALRVRVKRHAPEANVTFVPGNCDINVASILAAIPRHSPTHKVLSLCFVDPNDIGIKFQTLRVLSKRYVDFVVLLALYMDALRAEHNYVKNPSKINQLLGTPSWQQRWNIAKVKGEKFSRFLAEEFATSMAKLGYIPRPFHEMKKIYYYPKNRALYELGLFSRHPIAYKYWDQAKKYTDDQLRLF